MTKNKQQLRNGISWLVEGFYKVGTSYFMQLEKTCPNASILALKCGYLSQYLVKKLLDLLGL